MNTTTNITFDCDKYHHLKDLLLESPETNLTDLFSSCPGMCIVAYGTGNPDLAGIGAMASFTIQSGLSTILGATLLLCSFFIKRFYLVALMKLMDRFMFTQSLLLVAILIACYIRLGQTPNIFELEFMFYLIVNGAYTIISSGTIIYAVLVIGTSKTRPIELMWDWVMGNQVAKWRPLDTMQSRHQPLTHTKGHCFVRLRPNLPSHHGLLRLLSILSVIASIPLTVYYMNKKDEISGQIEQRIGISCPQKITSEDPSLSIWVISLSFDATVILMSFYVWLKLKQYYPKSIVLGPPLLLILIVGIAYTPQLVLVYIAWWYRSKLGVAVGGAFEDNEWGFGQILAIFTWIPTVLDLAYWTWTMIRNRKVYLRSWATTKFILLSGKLTDEEYYRLDQDDNELENGLADPKNDETSSQSGQSNDVDTSIETMEARRIQHSYTF